MKKEEFVEELKILAALPIICLGKVGLTETFARKLSLSESGVLDATAFAHVMAGRWHWFFTEDWGNRIAHDNEYFRLQKLRNSLSSR